MDTKRVTDARFLVLKIDEPNSGVKEYKRRRHHTKNRLGCLPCKQKRVKVGYLRAVAKE